MSLRHMTGVALTRWLEASQAQSGESLARAKLGSEPGIRRVPGPGCSSCQLLRPEA